MNAISTVAAALTLAVLAAVPTVSLGQAATPAAVYVNEYFGMKYKQEPVSWDITLDKPTPAADVRLTGTPSQVEVLAGTAEAATKVRLWTLVDFEQQGQQKFAVAIGAAKERPQAACTVADAETVGGIKIATVSNGVFSAKVPVGTVTFDVPKSAFEVPGPVVSVSGDGKKWFGSGYLDTILRVKSVTCKLEQGPVYWQSAITYAFEGGKTYTAKVRIYAGKPYVTLNEDFNLGGNARYVFNYDDWQPGRFLAPEDHALVKWKSVAEEENPAGDFIREEGQKCLARLVVWTQFGYFRGKQETLALKNDAMGTDTCTGAFYIRPDRWTRAKVNHVDLYERPEVPGDRMTRGIVGLAGSKPRLAMEAWLIDGHREWAIFAVPPGVPGTKMADVLDENRKPVKGPDGKNLKKEVPDFKDNVFLAKAHVTEGVWPLDRIMRMPLVWNADGSPVKPEDTVPTGGGMAYGGEINRVLKGTSDRGGLMTFNGSEGTMRGGYAGQAGRLMEWLKANGDKLNAAALEKAKLLEDKMVGPALGAYMAMDESAYPGRRAMLPWSDPEALNPFYQGMENMNFNADRYNSVSAVGAYLAAAGHPEGKKILAHGEEQMAMALDRYVYPQSGCWEESHGYFAHTLKNLTPLAKSLKARGIRNFFDDIRFARMFQWWCYTMSPRDPGFGDMRIQPPIGDHGLGGPDRSFADMKTALVEFAASKDPEIQKIARQMAWRMLENGVQPPIEIKPEQPDLNSRYVQGHGVIMRAWDSQKRESFITLRAEQSWGHHHMDKGSLWGWFHNVHFFGDAAWGGPPGETYGNSYKQGPASGTQIEFRGVNNWTLPCKYPAPWISDDEYRPGLYDYANARCMFPFNQTLNLEKSTAAATRNGYDRQVLLVHPDLLIVRDNVESTCQTIWRMHSYQVDGTKVEGNRVTMASPQKVTGELAMLYPPGVSFSTTAVKDELDGDTHGVGTPFGGGGGKGHGGGGGGGGGYDTRSMVIRWDMPLNTSATWTFGVHDDGQKQPASESLDKEGKVTRVVLPDGREVIALMSIEPFAYSGHGISFDGTVGLVIKQGGGGGKAQVFPIRATKLTAQ